MASIEALQSGSDMSTNMSVLAYRDTTMDSVNYAFTNNVSGTPDTDGNISASKVIYKDGCYVLDDPYFPVSQRIFICSSLVFIVIGLIGNSLSTLVFSSRSMRHVSSNVYLLVLATSDSIYLIVVFLSKVLTMIRCVYFFDSEADINNRSPIACKLLQYLLDLFSDYSTCLILAFTVERYLACYEPINVKDWCTAKRARLICFLVFAAIAALIAPYHIIFMHRYDEYNVCSVNQDYEEQFTILYIVEVMLFRIIPVIVVAILNVFIIVKITRLTRHRRTMSSKQQNNNTKKRLKKEEKSIQLTVMLIIVSSSYIILYLPVLIHFVMWKIQKTLNTISQEVMDITENYTKTLYIFGFAINFFLYTVSGKAFRDQLKMILCKSRMMRQNSLAASTQATQESRTLL